VKVSYDSKFDLLYLEFDASASKVRNQDAGDGVVLDITEEGRLAGIEILDASKLLDVSRLLPLEFEAASA
jgi:uncharacterized protein YuzE